MEYSNVLGSAAAGAAAAHGGAGGHSTGKMKGRASSARGASPKPSEASDRSRSPNDTQPDIKAEVSERVMVAPICVEPGAEGDAMGVEGRHRHNMQKLFGYLTHMEKVVNDHAEHLDAVAFEQSPGRRSNRELALEIKVVRAGLSKSEEEAKIIAGIVGANDDKRKSDLAASSQGIWNFLEANNIGIMELFQEPMLP